MGPGPGPVTERARAVPPSGFARRYAARRGIQRRWLGPQVDAARRQGCAPESAHAGTYESYSQISPILTHQRLTSSQNTPRERGVFGMWLALPPHRRQASRARLRAAALLGPPHERPGSAKRCLSAPQNGQDLAASAAFRPGCWRSLPGANLRHTHRIFPPLRRAH